jgi:uncharacterized protein
MIRTFKAAVAALMLAVSLAGSVAAGPAEDAAAAVAAHKRGDYATALRLIRPLADQGDADAQNILGLMYYSGRGVPQDYVMRTCGSAWRLPAETLRRSGILSPPK